MGSRKRLVELLICRSSRVDCLFVDGQQPGFILRSILSTRDELDKALTELAETSNSHRVAI